MIFREWLCLGEKLQSGTWVASGNFFNNFSHSFSKLHLDCSIVLIFLADMTNWVGNSEGLKILVTLFDFKGFTTEVEGHMIN